MTPIPNKRATTTSRGLNAICMVPTSTGGDRRER